MVVDLGEVSLDRPLMSLSLEDICIGYHQHPDTCADSSKAAIGSNTTRGGGFSLCGNQNSIWVKVVLMANVESIVERWQKLRLRMRITRIRRQMLARALVALIR